MDEDRIERALSQRPPDESAYKPALSPATLVPMAPLERVSADSRVRPNRHLGNFSAALVAVTVVALAIIIVAPRFGPVGPGSSGGLDLLATIRTRGAIRVAVPPGAPQVDVAGSYEGFDVVIAGELGRRLQVRVDIVPLDRDRLAVGVWDIAVGLPIETSGPTATYPYSDPYAYWPALVAVLSGSEIRALNDLRGHPVCIRYGSPVASWLAGGLDLVSPIAPALPPAVGDVYAEPSLGDCANKLRHPAADALIWDRLPAAQLGSEPGLRALPGPVFSEPIGIAVATNQMSPIGFVHELDRLLAQMRNDGMLAASSRAAFNGADITSLP